RSEIRLSSAVSSVERTVSARAAAIEKASLTSRTRLASRPWGAAAGGAGRKACVAAATEAPQPTLGFVRRRRGSNRSRVFARTRPQRPEILGRTRRCSRGGLGEAADRAPLAEVGGE